MTLPSFAIDTVKVISAQLVQDREFSFARDWSDATETSVSGCYFMQSGGSSDISDREQYQVDAVCYLPPDVEVSAQDLIEHEGNRYTIEGSPAFRKSPSGALDHIEVALRRWNG